MAISNPAPMQPVQRAFAVLEVLSRRQFATLNQLQGLTRLPRPTVARMLETLIALGYVRRISRQHGYRVTDKVLGLSAGLRFIDRLVDAAVDPMERFTRSSGWPLVLGTIADGAILVRHSTIPISPLSFEASSFGVRVRLLESAMGRVCLAYCSSEDRKLALGELASLKGLEAPDSYWQAMLETPEKLDEELRSIRLHGFAGTRSSRSARVNGIAVPVLLGGIAIAGLTMRYPKSAMSESDAAQRYVPNLRAIARAVAATAGRSIGGTR